MNQFKTFSISQAFSFGFSTYFENIGLYLKIALACIACFLAAIFIGLISIPFVALTTPPLLFLNPLTLITMPLAALVSLLLYLFLIAALLEIYYYQMLHIGMLLYDKQPVTWHELFNLQFNTFIQYLSARFFYYLKVILGLILFVIPGIYFALKGYFTGYAIIDRKAHSLPQDKEIAYTLSAGIMGKLFLFAILLALCTNILGMLLVAVLFMPIIYLTQIHVYKQLLMQEIPTILHRESIPEHYT